MTRAGCGRPDAPVLAAWGAGVDSTAFLIEMIERGERIDQVLFADTGSEKPQTYAFVDLFRRWLAERGVPCEVEGSATIVRCLIPRFDGAPFTTKWKDSLWAKFSMGAPQRLRRSVERYSIVKRA